MVGSQGEHPFWTAARFREHWKVLAVAGVIATVLGAALGLLKPVVHHAEVRLSVGSGSMSELNIPGFPTASMELAANYARWVNSRGMAGLDLPQGTGSVTASPFPQSNVLRVEVAASSENAATSAANAVAQRLVREVNAVATGKDPDKLLERVVQRAREATAAQLERDRARARLDRELAQTGDATSPRARAAREEFLRIAAQAARAELIVNGLQDRYRRLVSNASTEATLSVVGDGAILTGTSRLATTQRYAIVGLGIGLVIGILRIRVVESRRQRRE